MILQALETLPGVISSKPGTRRSRSVMLGGRGPSARKVVSGPCDFERFAVEVRRQGGGTGPLMRTRHEVRDRSCLAGRGAPAGGTPLTSSRPPIPSPSLAAPSVPRRGGQLPRRRARHNRHRLGGSRPGTGALTAGDLDRSTSLSRHQARSTTISSSTACCRSSVVRRPGRARTSFSRASGGSATGAVVSIQRSVSWSCPKCSSACTSCRCHRGTGDCAPDPRAPDVLVRAGAMGLRRRPGPACGPAGRVVASRSRRS